MIRAATERALPRALTGFLFHACTPLLNVTMLKWACFGIPWMDFEPTLKNWVDQLASPESRRALGNASSTANGRSSSVPWT